MSRLASSALMGGGSAIEGFGKTLDGIVQRLADGPFSALTRNVDALTATSSLLTSDLTGFHGQLVAAGASMGRFVEAVNPSMMLVWNQTIRDLNAALGAALMPAFTVLTNVVREIGQVLGPVFSQIAKALQPVIEALSGAAIVAVKAIATAFAALAPFIEIAAKLFAAVVESMSALVEAIALVVNAMFGAISGALSKDLFTTFADNLKKFFQQFATGIIVLAAAIAKFVGATGMVDRMISMAAGPAKQDNTGLAAATGASMVGFSEFGRRMSTAASLATAGSSGEKKPEVDWMKEAVKEVVKIRDGQRDLPGILAEWGKAFAKALAQAIVVAIRSIATAGVAYAKQEGAAVAATAVASGDTMGDAIAEVTRMKMIERGLIQGPWREGES